MTTTANMRRTLIAIAEQAMLAFGGDLSREQVSALLPLWRCASVLDDDMRAEVLSRFSPAEPPNVPGLDWLPQVKADAAVLVAETVAVLDPTDWSQYGECPKCDAPAGEACCSTVRPRLGMLRTRPHIQRPMVARPTEVTP